MSVFTVTICEKVNILNSERYAVEADSVDEACKITLGAHSMYEKRDPNEYEITAAQKTGMRRCLTPEPVESVYA